jgi:hypothetical protein
MRIPSPFTGLVLTGCVLAGCVLFAACEAKTPPDASKPAGAQAGNQPANPPANVGKAPAADDGILPVAKPVQTPGAGIEQGPPRPQNPDMDAGRMELMTRPVTTGNITVKHVLLAFKGTGTKATRTKEEALAQAKKVYAEAIGGADFDALMRQSDDTGGGTYTSTEIATFVHGFQDIALRLRVGEIGVAPYDAAASQFGWHVIKRIK